MCPAESWNVISGNVQDLSVPLHGRRYGRQRLVGTVHRDLGVSPDALALPGAGVGRGDRSEGCRGEDDREDQDRDHETGNTGCLLPEVHFKISIWNRSRGKFCLFSSFSHDTNQYKLKKL